MKFSMFECNELVENCFPLFCYAPIGRVNPGKYGQGGKYGHMIYNSNVKEHMSVTKECSISALNSIYSALLHPYTTYI